MNLELRQNHLFQYPQLKRWKPDDLENYFTKLETILPQTHTLSEKQDSTLKDIYVTLQKIDNILGVCKDAGLNYELSIAGGAVYDLIHDKNEHTKDFDIVVFFPELQQYKGTYNQKDKSKEDIAKEITPEARIAIHKLFKKYAKKDAKENMDYKQEELFLLITNIINTEHTVKSLSFNHEGQASHYINDQLWAIAKVQSDKLAKPVDIIFTKTTTSVFCNSFDFNLCKTFIPYKGCNEETKKMISFVKHNKDHTQLLDNIITQREFLYDSYNKVLTINCSKFNEEHINYFMGKHYLKMKDKFPEHTLNFTFYDKTMKPLISYHIKNDMNRNLEIPKSKRMNKI